MRTFLLALYILSYSGLSWGGLNLKVGDVLLQPLNCWLCSLIEAEELSIYSHMGVVVSSDPLLVAEAFSVVRTVSLKEFNAKTEKGQSISVLRFKDAEALLTLGAQPKKFLALFQNEFEGKKYDNDFLWNNIDENGDEKIYCSELVTKLFDNFLGLTVPLKQMQFQRKLADWERYFKGKVPIGEWGNSPGDFDRSALFDRIGEI